MQAVYPVYKVIASMVQAISNCVASNLDWEQHHRATLKQVIADFMPSGSGWDAGTSLAITSTPERLEFVGEYHHMNDVGMYDGWSAHSIVVTPSLQFGTRIRVTGRDRNGIKEYLEEVFDTALDTKIMQVRVVEGHTVAEGEIKYVLWEETEK